MSTEKYWQTKEYAKDIHTYLREREMKRYVYWGRSNHPSKRKELVEWMKSIVEKKEYHSTVLHLSVYLFDIFMDNHYCQATHLKIACIACLNVAVKLEDEGFAPKNSEYAKMLGNQYKLAEFVHMEMTLLSFFDCMILFPTAAHFVEYYALYALSPSDEVENEPDYDRECLKTYVEKYTKYFLGLPVTDTYYYQFSPSLVAACCILSTRTCLSILPDWPVTLQNVTGYKYEDLKPCLVTMIRNLNLEATVSITQKYVSPEQSITIVQE